MRCISWNCRGLGNSRSIQNLGEIIRFVVNIVGRGGGLALLWKQPMTCNLLSFSE